MAFPQAAGGKVHSGTLIPTVWAKNFIKFFYMSTVLAAISNTDYEGELKNHGDTLKMNVLTGGASHEYADKQDLVYDEPDSDTIDLEINRGRYFAFNASYIDKAQSNLAFIEKWADHYAQITKRDIEHVVLSNVFAEVDTANSGAAAGVESGDIDLGSVGTPLVPTKADIVDSIVDWGDVLDQQNIPSEGRWLTLPTWACAMIKKSDIKDASIMGDGKSALRTGRIGMIDRFEIFSSNNLAKGTDGGSTVFNGMFGHKSAITFASQLTKQERFMNPKTFGEQIRALQSYGFKVIQPTALGHLYIAKS